MEDWQILVVTGMFVALFAYVALKAGKHYYRVSKQTPKDPLQGLEYRR